MLGKKNTTQFEIITRNIVLKEVVVKGRKKFALKQKIVTTVAFSTSVRYMSKHETI
jgi:hypothetical protein